MAQKTTKIFIYLILHLVVMQCQYYKRPKMKYPDEKKIRYILLTDRKNNLQFVDLQQPIPKVKVATEKVTFYYKSRFTNLLHLNLYSTEKITSTDFDPERNTMFIIHGWSNNYESDVNTEISTALLEMNNWNIFIVDWEEPANEQYLISIGAVPDVGEIIAAFIKKLIQITNLELENISLVGFSLGAHVAGQVGSEFNGKIGVIIGLDPASPGFGNNPTDSRLDPSDAQYVQVIHTNGLILGYESPIGHSDFFPNGGLLQSGCGSFDFTCSHSRSYLYFAESLRNNQFFAVSCESYADFDKGKCDFNEVAYMGGVIVDKKARGNYYLNTATKKPFGLGFEYHISFALNSRIFNSF